MSGFDVDVSEIDDLDDLSGGSWLGKSDGDVGKYHFLVQSVDTHEGETWDDGRPKDISVICTVLAPAEKVGKYARLDLAKGGHQAGVKRTLRWAKVTGVWTDEDQQRAKEARAAGTGNGKVNIPFENAVGASFCAEWKKNPYEDKETKQQKHSYKMGFDFYRPEDEEVKDWPKDLTMVAPGDGGDDSPF